MNIQELQVEDCDPLQPCATCDLFEDCTTNENVMLKCFVLGESKRLCKPKN